MKYTMSHWFPNKKNLAINNNLNSETSIPNTGETKSSTSAKPAVTESILTYLLLMEVIRRALPLESEKTDSNKSRPDKDNLKNNSYYKKWKKRTVMLK